MFFSNEILTKKGGQFAVVWLVGNFNTVHGSKRLGLKKSDYVSVDVVKACDDMLNPRTQFALRLSSTLLMGIIRIYEKQITIVYDEVKSMWIFLKKGSFMRPENVELPSLRSETFALPNPLYHYDKEMGNEQSDIRFYTSLGEKALFEGQGVAKATHESRADSAYFTISFGDQELTNAEYETSMAAIAEESPAKRRKVSKDSFLDIIEDPHTPLKLKEKASVMPIEVPGVDEFEALVQSDLQSDLLDISEEQLNEKFAECSQLQTSDLEMTKDDASSMLGGGEGGMLTRDEIPSELGITTLDPITEDSNLENPLLGLQGATDLNMSGVDETRDYVTEPQQENIGDMILEELSSRIQNDPFLNEMNKENEPPVSLDFTDANKENEPPITDAVDKGNVDQVQPENAENVQNAENVSNLEKENDETLVEEDPDKENRDPNAVRRSQRATKKPLRLAQDKAFDATNSFVLPAAPTPKDAPVKRKRKRQLVVDKNNQLSVKEMKKFMKNSRQALCSDPVLVHKIRPGPEELFREAHRSYVKRVPELKKLWDRCAHSGDHDLSELLQRQQDIDAELSRNATTEQENAAQDDTVETSRKRPRSSVLSDVEIARFGGNSTLQDISEMEGDLSRLDSTEGMSRDSDNFNAAGFRTSTVMKPIRESGLAGPMLSPIQQLENFEESEIRLDPQELLPIMEEPTIQDGNLSDLAQPDPVGLSEIQDISSDILQETSTMFGQDTRNVEMTDRALTPVNESEMRASSPERPRTPLIERLSGVPQEETVAGENNMSSFKYFPNRESQKFYGFVKRNFKENKDSITFEELVPRTHTGKTAALAFYQLLLLKKFNHVEVNQDEETYFGDITIKLKH